MAGSVVAQGQRGMTSTLHHTASCSHGPCGPVFSVGRVTPCAPIVHRRRRAEDCQPYQAPSTAGPYSGQILGAANRWVQQWSREIGPISIRSKLRLLRRNFLVGSFGADVTTSLLSVNLNVIWHSSCEPSGLKIAVSPSMVAMPLPSPSLAIGPCVVLYS